MTLDMNLRMTIKVLLQWKTDFLSVLSSSVLFINNDVVVIKSVPFRVLDTRVPLPLSLFGVLDYRLSLFPVDFRLFVLGRYFTLVV